MFRHHPELFKPPYPPPGPPFPQDPCYPAASDFPYRPLPPSYPYIKPIVDNTYAGEVYHEHNRFPVPGQLPASGPLKGNAFVVKNYYPYLIDTSFIRYGHFLSMPENVVTRISRRPNDTCVDLFGTFDLTTGINKNSILADYLKKCIAHKCEEMHNVFPIMKPTLTFRLYYQILDEMGQIVHSAVSSAMVNDIVFHFTDVRDYYIESAKSIFLTNIPTLDYAGIYRLRLERLEVYADVVNTYDHITGDLNPFYAFTDNNTRIALQPEAIEAVGGDESIMISSTEINQVIGFQAKITTKFKLSFTAFLSDLVVLPDTMPIYSAMYEPNEVTLATLKKDVVDLRESIMLINTSLADMKNAINELRSKMGDHEERITNNTKMIEALNQDMETNIDTLETRVESLENRVTILESRPLALNKYKTGAAYVASQLVYNKYGQLYQATKAFNASGNMNTEIAAGRLVPLVVDGEVFENANAVVVDELVTRVEAVENDMSNAKSDITSNSNNIQINADRITSVVERVDTAETDIDNLKTRMTSAESNIALNQASITSHTTSIATNTTNISNLQTSLGTMSDNITTLQGDVETLKTDVQSNTSTIGVLSTTVTQHTTDIATLRSDTETALGTKANTTDVDAALLLKADASALEDYATTEALSAVETKLDALDGSVVQYVTTEEYEALVNKSGIYAIKDE
jgi:peptidoglycan hydrolase CwlO-like protein